MWGINNERIIATYTKDYKVDASADDLDIPNVLLNFVGRKPRHSKCIVEFVDAGASATLLQKCELLA